MERELTDDVLAEIGSIGEMSDSEFDALYGGRELNSDEQAAYEAEGAMRFAKYHRRLEFK